MTTKTCEKCGWVLAIQDPTTLCPICHTRFNQGICKVCGKASQFYLKDRSVCRDCFLYVCKKSDDDARLTARRRAVYEEWKAKIASVPTDYPTLSEAQWIEACRYFGGCACCDSERIDARGYFVPFNEGGRYCDWNIVPMCERCATAFRKNGNKFMRRSRPTDFAKVLNYLEDKLNAASKN